jgi:hypothetical protein
VTYTGGYTHSQNTQVLNNTIIGTVGDGFGIEFGNAYGVRTVQNNIIFSAAANYINGGSVVDHNLNETTLAACGFTNYSGDDYTLSAGSAAKDTGISVMSYGVTFDGANSPRPFGAGYDIGAYERQS